MQGKALDNVHLHEAVFPKTEWAGFQGFRSPKVTFTTENTVTQMWGRKAEKSPHRLPRAAEPLQLPLAPQETRRAHCPARLSRFATLRLICATLHFWSQPMVRVFRKINESNALALIM